MRKDTSGVACGQVKAAKHIEFRYVATSSFSWDICKQSHKTPCSIVPFIVSGLPCIQYSLCYGKKASPVLSDVASYFFLNISFQFVIVSKHLSYVDVSSFQNTKETFYGKRP